MRRGYFGASPDSGKEPFCIVLPPPNITGALHVGHALNHTLMDILVRRKRMQGYETLWLPGTDHAGIATQVVVERELAKEGIDRRELGREAFLERVWAWKEQYGGRIVEQMKALGNSCDWSRLRFTMDEGLVQAVREAFVRLYEGDLIYRGERLVNWCPKDTTALSDSEVEHEDVEGELITFRYDLSDGSGHVDVATTRVETMLGDTGVAVHPDDDRYTDLVGKTLRHPFTGQDLPIVADEAVDPTFGTGAVKVTPAHDPTDFEIGRRHGMPLVNILTAEARISTRPPRSFGAWTGTRPGRASWSASGAGQGGERGTPLPPLGGPLLPLSHRDRAVARRTAVVRGRGPAEGTGEAGRGGRQDHLLARTVDQRLHAMARHAPGLEHLAPAVVGPPDPGLVLRRTDTSSRRGRTRTCAPNAGPPTSSRIRTCWTRGSRRSCGRSQRSAGRIPPKTCGSSIQRTSCSPATRSSISGWPAW